MRPATLVLLCALPLCGCIGEGSADPGCARRAESQDLRRFEDVERQTARERRHTAFALAAGPERLYWGVAVAAPTPAQAKSLALSRCMARVRQDRVAARCDIYAVNGQPLYLGQE